MNDISDTQLALARVRLRARLRTEWLRNLWRQTDAGQSVAAVTHAEVDLCLDDRDSPEAEQAWLSSADFDADRVALAEIEDQLGPDAESRLSRLRATFGLSDASCDLIHVCVASQIEPSLLRVYAYLQDVADHTYVTDALVARLFGHGRTLGIESDDPAFRWAMIQAHDIGPGEQPAYRLDAGLFDWLLGGRALDADLTTVADRSNPGGLDRLELFEEWPIDETIKEITRWIDGEQSSPVRVRVIGPEGIGRRTFAAIVAARFGMSLLTVDATHTETDVWTGIERTMYRRALLDDHAVCLLPPASFWSQPRPTMSPAVPLHFVISESEQMLPHLDDTIDYTVVMPAPTINARRSLWRLHAPWCENWPSDEFEALVRQHRVLPGDISHIAKRGESTFDETSAMVRLTARQSLGQLAQRLECPFERDDLVVTSHVSEALDDLLFEAHDRIAFWELTAARRLFPQGRGLLALFSGPSGTGKTMSAQVVAAMLGMDLFRIDLAAVVSKWVGETSKNLDRLLRRAADLDVVLLFDEADALFGKRTDVKEANDRFANSDTGYLLQAIESYRGVALLSTNRKGDIDSAFIRRLRYVLEFPVPTEFERLQLWEKIVGELAGTEQAAHLGPTLERLAGGVEVTGAQIKLAVLTAVFVARRERSGVTSAHLLRGLERELAKDGRSIGDRLRERLSSDG